MIFGDIAVLLNLLSIMAFSAFFIVYILAIVIRFTSERINQYAAFSRRQLLWIVVLSPWLVSLIAATLAILSGTQYTLFPQSYNLLHWHHADEFAFFSWHGFSTIAAIIFVSILVIKNIFRMVRNEHQLSLLHALAEPDNKGFYQLDADAAMAFTAGYLKPRCYITSGLRTHLNDKELEIIGLHEKAHARYFDPIKKALFKFLTAFFPFGISKKLYQSMSLTMEQCADLAVTRKTADKSTVALTLLKVRRLVVQPFENIKNNTVICHYAFDNIEARIGYILSEQKYKKLPIFAISLLTIFMTLACALSADVFHHVIEYSLSH